MRNTTKMLLITEILSKPFDEGMKNVAYSLHKHLKKMVTLLTITKHDNDVGDLDIKKVKMDRLFLSRGLRYSIRNFSPDSILYMPETSITFNSFLRGRILKSISKRSQVILFATIKRNYNIFQRFIISRFLNPDMVFLFGNFKGWLPNNINTYILPPAIDIDRFSVATKDEKIRLRRKYNISLDKRVVLHVGHVRPTRNVSIFIKVQRVKDIQVLIVDSTSTPQYEGLHKKLKKEGIIILHRYIPDISEIYKLSDIYVFPVKDEIASINLPLSILEAMACGLPVITTRFGGIEEYFKDDNGFRYFDTDDELVKLICQSEMDGKSNREKVREFTWERLVNDMMVYMHRYQLK